MKRIAGISILLNVALLVVWMRMGNADTDQLPPGSAPQKIVNKTIVTTNYVEVLESVNIPEPKFEWSMVESESFEEYMANLRRLECPEWLVKEIVAEELMIYYHERELELRHERAPLFWANNRERRASNREFEQARLKLYQENYDVMNRLVGGFRHEDRDEFIWENGVLVSLFSGMSYVQALNVTSELMFQHTRKEMLDDVRDGFLTPTDIDQLAQGYRQMKVASMVHVSHAVFDEFWLRLQTVLGSLVSNFDLPGMQLNGYQLRELMRVRIGIIDPVECEFTGEDGPEDRELVEMNQLVAAAIANRLGERFASDYSRSQDPAFRQIFEFTSRQNLPHDTAIEVFDVRQTAIDQVRSLMTDPNYDESTRGELRQLIQIEIEQTLQNTIGSTAYPTYRERNGDWIDRVGGSVATDDAGGRR